jgi:hypothetical protein
LSSVEPRWHLADTRHRGRLIYLPDKAAGDITAATDRCGHLATAGSGGRRER